MHRLRYQLYCHSIANYTGFILGMLGHENIYKFGSANVCILHLDGFSDTKVISSLRYVLNVMYISIV